MMLPDFPRVKRKIAKDLTAYLRRKVRNSDPFIRQIRVQEIHEGHRQIMRTYEGIIDETKFHDIGSEFTVPKEEIIEEGPEALMKHIDKLAEDILGQQGRIMFQKMHEITSITGNIAGSPNTPFGPDLLLEALSKIAVEFDENGQPANLMVVMHPDLWNKIKDKVPEWEADPEFKKKYDAIIEKKKREWLDRENHRKLVD